MGTAFIYFLTYLVAISTVSGYNENLGPARDFSRHNLVQLTVSNGRTKREILSTRHSNGAHHSEVMVSVPVETEQLVLDLHLNEHLLTEGHTLLYQQGGDTVRHTPTREELDLCHYSGSVRHKPQSWVAVSTCHGVRGVIFDGEKMRYIEPAHGNDILSPHYVYEHDDLKTEHHCGYHAGDTNDTHNAELHNRLRRQAEINKSRVSRYKRESEFHVRGPYKSNNQSRYLELVLVADHEEFLASGSNTSTVHTQLIQLANIVNSLYTPLNIYIALVGVVVWSERDEIAINETGDFTLTNFLNYRKSKLNIELPNDNAHLITRQKFTGGVVGKALKGPMCSHQFSGGVSVKHSVVIGLLATTVAHVIGHNFGMEHDVGDFCECPNEKCIMNPSYTSKIPVHWSSCSIESLNMYFDRGMDYCLHNKPKRLVGSPSCGNGFVEPGEQCDCGVTVEDLSNKRCHACCNPDTCMLRNYATCAAGECCDPNTCSVKPAGVVCRSADVECDLPEYCSGHSEYCPEDVHKMDSTPCGTGHNQAYCMRGACKSHSDQCRLLWGSTGQSAHLKCYNNNIRGNKNGNCGYDPVRQVYKPCAPDDALCGMLQCRHLNERLEFGMESLSFLSAVFINSNGTIIPCRTAIIDLGINDVDPGLVPDGAKCGPEHMCLKQKCVPVSAVREAVANLESSVCPSDCSGHGVCNSKGQCHCEAGLAPPLCAEPGLGDSIISKPATEDPKNN